MNTLSPKNSFARIIPARIFPALILCCLTGAVDSASAAQSSTSSTAAQDQTLAAQVKLDRLGFSVGEIDGRWGRNSQTALSAFRTAQGSPPSGRLDRAAHQLLATADPAAATTSYLILEADVGGPFAEAIPDDLMEQAELPALDYTSPLELLAERFHAAPALLRRLNPGASFLAGESIVVPNVTTLLVDGAIQSTVEQDPAVPPPATAEPKIAAETAVPATVKAPADATAESKVESKADATVESKVAAKVEPKADAKVDVEVVVSASQRTLRVSTLDATPTLLLQAPVSVGTDRDPLPLGGWKVKGTGRLPVFNYNPELFWDADASHAKAVIKPGPNNPVGLVWIDLDKEQYGLHGTAKPERIGHHQSHGCVRLTNWDALRVAALVRPGTRVVFVK